jgi:hypothetical protein
VARVSDGKYTVTFGTGFSSRNYAVLGTGRRESAAGSQRCVVVIDKDTAPTASACTILTLDAADSVTFIQEFYVVFFGDFT